MKTYYGNTDTPATVSDGYWGRYQLNPRLDIKNIGRTGLTWGYMGSGPKQLAIAILADFADAEIAKQYYYDFARLVIAGLPYPEWALTDKEVGAALKKIKAVATAEQ